MAETKARFLANLIGADNTANDFTLPNTAVSGTDNKVLTSGGDGTVTWEATELAPETTSISPTEVASDAGGNITFTLTGANYATSGMTVHFIATSGSDITSGMTVTHGTATSFTVTVARSSFVDANEPYSIKVTKSSGLTHTLVDALRVDNAPSWSTYVGTLSGSPPVVASIMDNISSATHATLSATDAEGDSVTYSETTNTLTNAGMTLSSAGAITGTPTAVSSDTNYDFTARATSTGDGGATTKTTDQNFRFTIINYVPPQLFAGKTYSGNSASSLAITFDETNDFQPDLVWIKSRSTEHHRLFDSVRTPTGGSIRTSQTNPADYSGSDLSYGYLSAFGTDGFTVNDGSLNANATKANGTNYMSWAWKAGGAPSSSALSLSGGIGAGTIANDATGVSNATSITQSVNQNGGFSITKFTGSTSGGNFPHNLGGTPDWVIIKNIDATQHWSTWHSGTSANFGYLSKPDSFGARTAGRFPTIPDSTKIYFGNDGNNGGTTDEFICYAWKAVSNYSAFGSYTGTGSSAFTAQNLGFQPRWIMFKNISRNATEWPIHDSFRGNAGGGGSGVGARLYAQAPDAESNDASTQTYSPTITSTGFTFPTTVTHDYWNYSGDTFIYMAFA
jgi:hypothetical protein